MAVPFSSTHLRVPRGFGSILEGLSREVLRDQPKDIPKYAAQYFSGLLKQRQESGVDPAEWAAKLEDGFYKTHPVEAGPSAEPEKEDVISQETSHKTQTGEESDHSAEASPLSPVPHKDSEEVDKTVSTEEEERVDNREKHISLEDGLSEEECINRVAHSDKLSGRDHEKIPVITTLDQVDLAANENRSMSPPSTNVSQPQLQKSDLSLNGVSNIDVCSQELGMTAGWHELEARHQVGDKETGESQTTQSAEVRESVDVVAHSGLADVNVCAEELQSTEGTLERGSVGAHVIEQEAPHLEEMADLSSSCQPENPECSQQEADDITVTTAENKTEAKDGLDETEAPTDNEQKLHMKDGFEDHATPAGDSLVEVCFEDVPEVEQIHEVEKNQSVDLQIKTSEMQESKQVSAVGTDQNVCDAKDHKEPEMEEQEENVKSKWEEMESHQETSDVTKEDLQTDILEKQDDESQQVFTVGADHKPYDTEDHDQSEMEELEEDAKSRLEEMEAFDVMKADLQTEILEEQDDESKLVSTVGTGHNTDNTQDHNQPEIETLEKDESKLEETESQQETFDVMDKKEDTSESDSSDGDDDDDTRDVKNSPSQWITERKENPSEDETDKKEDHDMKSEVEPHQEVDSDTESKCESADDKSKEEEMSDTDGEDIHTQDYSSVHDTAGGSSQAAHVNISTRELEEGSESLQVSAERLPEGEARTLKGTEVTSKEPMEENENLKEGQVDSEVQNDPDDVEGVIRSRHHGDPTNAGDLGQQRPGTSEKDRRQHENETQPENVTEVSGRSKAVRGSDGGATVSREEERVEALQRARREVTERLIREMSLEEHRELTAQLMERQPGLLFDALMMYQRRHGAPPVGQLPEAPWCTCGNCRDMSTDRERKCCGQDPEYCFSMLPHFSHYCLDEGYLRVHRQYRDEFTRLGQITEQGDDNREYRYAAYRHFIFWQHGSLSQGNQQDLPSCCVWKIRNKFPDPQGHYTVELQQLMD